MENLTELIKDVHILIGDENGLPLIKNGLIYVMDTRDIVSSPRPKQEWKRYKQYSRDDITQAIEAVKSGVSPVQAARMHGVPSRTLYDKVKKLGISTPRPFKRAPNGSSTCFSYGIGGNVKGVYSRNLAEN